MSIFPDNNKNHLKSKMFFDETGGVDIARYEQVKYKDFDHLYRKMRGFFWTPDEVDLNKDRQDFAELSDSQKHIFTSNLKRQILLDSVQGRGVNIALLPHVSVPELEPLIETWGFFETIHSDSYTHIIRNVYANPSAVFDTLLSIKEIVDCSKDITKYYDSFIDYANLYKIFGYGVHTFNGNPYDINEYELKKRFWLMMMSINILEGIRFYVSFACSWAFAENKLMEGNAKIIKLIARDENCHLAVSQKLLRTYLIKDDPIFAKISSDTEEESIQMYEEALLQEKQWAKYLFKNGSIVGLNNELLSLYVDYIGAQRMRAINLKPRHDFPKSDPLPWTNSWISSKSRQVAPQETEVESYVMSNIKSDLLKDSFSDFEL